ncbi:IS630 family transposase [Paraflavisolibacter sp. H34]|uniref:IS630 family transposase n=1 Tax=Huijunlia imazamoxiresistens TaxID=3127457 RepID=UPI00301AB75E
MSVQPFRGLIQKVDAAFLAGMEKVLWLYAQPYDERYPVVCFDERPCFLIGDEVEPISMQTGRVKREHYTYEKNGSCALLAAIEPLTGKRKAAVYERRTKKEYALFLKALAKAYPKAVKIRLVQDNLNTHNASSFYEHLPAAEAFALAQRFEFYYTPKSASWLNMIEIEFSALVKQCLNRRIPTQERLIKEVGGIVKERNKKRIKINWQFSIQTARKKLNSVYQAVNPLNDQYKGT